MDKLSFSSDELQKNTKRNYEDLKKAELNLMVIADGHVAFCKDPWKLFVVILN